MLGHRGAGLRLIVGGQRRQHPPVVLVRVLRPPLDRGKHGLGCIPGDLRHQLRQFRRIRGDVDRPVEVVIQPDRALAVACGIRSLQIGLHRSQVSQRGIGDHGGRASRQFPADESLHLGDIGDVAAGHRSDDETATRLLVEQTFGLQLEQRLTHRGHADAELGGQLIETDIASRGVRPVEDPASHHRRHVIGELRPAREIRCAHHHTR